MSNGSARDSCPAIAKRLNCGDGDRADFRRNEGKMLFLVVLLLVLWFLGMVTTTTLGGLLHILLVVAIVLLLVRVIQGRPV
jgi:hypothetical protein